MKESIINKINSFFELDVFKKTYQDLIPEKLFSKKININIEDMNTSSYSAAHTGTPMFAVRMTVGIPSDIQISGLREDFMEFCDSMNLDAVLEPAKG